MDRRAHRPGHNRGFPLNHVTATKTASASSDGGDRRSPALTISALGALVVVGLIGWWGLSGRSDLQSVEVGEPIDLPGGLLVVEQVRPEIMVHNLMPGMTMPDPVPEGYQRFAVDLLFVGRGRGMTVEPGDLYVQGEGLARLGPHRVTGDTTSLPEGARLSVGALFQTPVDAASIWLGYGNAGGVVVLQGIVGDGHTDGDHEASGQSEAVNVLIDDRRFLDSMVTITTGATVAWENQDRGVPHTVSFEDGPNSGTMQPGDHFSRVFDAPGTYPYVCEIHPSMRGEIVVVPAG